MRAVLCLACLLGFAVPHPALSTGTPLSQGTASRITLEATGLADTASAVDRLETILPDAPLVVHFWATWCVPCRAEQPELADFRDGLPEELGTRLVVVSVDKRPRADVERFLGSDMELHGFQTYLVDPAEAGSRFQIKGYPLTLFLTADGTVIRRVSGAAPWASETFRAQVREHLGQAD